MFNKLMENHYEIMQKPKNCLMFWLTLLKIFLNSVSKIFPKTQKFKYNPIISRMIFTYNSPAN